MDANQVQDAADRLSAKLEALAGSSSSAGRPFLQFRFETVFVSGH